MPARPSSEKKFSRTRAAGIALILGGGVDATRDGEGHVDMASADTLLRPEPLPVEHLLFDRPLARVGAFCCPAGHPLFADSGPIVNPIFVFPRTAVWIPHDGRAPFLPIRRSRRARARYPPRLAVEGGTIPLSLR